MDKRKEANLRVRRQITDTLFALMQKKSLSEITVSEIVKGAGVARASFYRNYCSKEDVLVMLIRDVLDDFRSKLSPGQESFYTYENILLSFRYFHAYRTYLLDLYHSGFLSVVLEELNQFHESIDGTMPSSSIEKYQLYMYIGALCNTAMEWLLERDSATPEEMAQFFFRAIPSIPPPSGIRGGSSPSPDRTC